MQTVLDPLYFDGNPYTFTIIFNTVEISTKPFRHFCQLVESLFELFHGLSSPETPNTFGATYIF
jgi:hypothetical protein